MQKNFQEILDVILERQRSGGEGSYVASLMGKGADAILKKIGEETAEVIIASKNDNRQACIHELTDLFFHMLVLMADAEISLTDIETEFGRRFGRSGLVEKENRTLK